MVLVRNLKFLHVFIFGEINQQNVFDITLESQKTFLDYKKNRKLKKSKNQDFSKGG